jgi:hypothetical protein
MSQLSLLLCFLPSLVAFEPQGFHGAVLLTLRHTAQTADDARQELALRLIRLLTRLYASLGVYVYVGPGKSADSDIVRALLWH